MDRGRCHLPQIVAASKYGEWPGPAGGGVDAAGGTGGALALGGRKPHRAARAQADNYAALRISAEMTWALRGIAGAERLGEQEAKMNYLVAHAGLVALPASTIGGGSPPARF